jgi:uncharacterized protein (TIGR00730 family)
MIRPIARLCVFCGSRPGARSTYLDQATKLGTLLAERRIGLVYGGASVGLMGALADAVLAGGGDVIGVIPEALAAKELAHGRVADLRVVGSMHERKALMSSLADGFIALPGGFGTFEELFEMVTWAQLGLHHKPFGVLNVAGYYNGLLALVDHAVEEAFIPPQHRELILASDNAADLLDLILGYEPPPPVTKWIRSVAQT